MRSSTTSIFIILFLIYVSQNNLTLAQPALDCIHCNSTNGNYISNSTYSQNLKTLLSNLYSATQINNVVFYNVSFGKDPDRVYGATMCRADLSPVDCRNSRTDAAKMLINNCRGQKEAIGYYYVGCMVRYSNRPIYQIKENAPKCGFNQSTHQIAEPEPEKVNQSIGNLFREIKRETSSGNLSYKFASGYREISETHHKIYALAQCNPYLSLPECSDCLEEVMSELRQCCISNLGAKSYGPICSVEFANYPLIKNYTRNSQQQNSSENQTDSADPGIRSGNKRSYKTWIIIVSVVCATLIVTLIFGISRRKMRKKLKKDDGNGLVDSLQLDFASIQFATDNFSDSKRLGNGIATAVYKGVLPDGQEIVVKKLYKGGRDIEQEFDNEILLLTNLQHKNLLKLLGFCIEKDLRFLVYEFLPNGSLEGFLNDTVKRSSLDWQTRYHIISGLGRGLLYLHEDSQVRVIHRDLKTSNILLGAQMDPKISNFRIASLVQADHARKDSKIVGTYGYMPREYVQHGYSSIKSDVFSYGVILLEIITGNIINRFSDTAKEESLPTYVWKNWSDGNVLDVVDKALANIQRHAKQIARWVKIALLCFQEDPRQRPTMSAVVLMLNSDTVDVAEPTKPAPLILNSRDLHSDCHSNQADKSNDTSIYEDSTSDLDPR